ATPPVDLGSRGFVWAVLHQRRELRLVLRLRQADDVVAAVLEIEPDDVELRPQRRLDVAREVDVAVFGAEPAKGGQSARELAQQHERVPELLRVEVRLDRDQDRRARRHDLRGSRTRVAAAATATAAACSGERETGDQGGGA